MTNQRWLPTEAEIDAAVARQREERIRLAQRVDDGPQTILMPRGYVIRHSGEFVDARPHEDAMQTVGRFWRGLLIAAAIAAGLSLAVLVGWVAARGHL